MNFREWTFLTDVFIAGVLGVVGSRAASTSAVEMVRDFVFIFWDMHCIKTKETN